MAKAARAMVAAKVGNYSPASNRALAKHTGVDRRYVDHAAVVLKYAEHLAAAVIAGTLPLNDAYAKALERKRAGRT
jgi:hypothetical protein